MCPEARDLVFCPELRTYFIHVSWIETESRHYYYYYLAFSPHRVRLCDCFSPLRPEGLYLMNVQAVKSPERASLEMRRHFWAIVIISHQSAFL